LSAYPRTVSRVAHAFWPRWYRFIALGEPLTRRTWRRFGIGNFVEVVIPGRRSGEPRSVFLGLLTTGDRTYLGHPDGECTWTRNLDAAGGGELVFHDGARQAFRSVRLDPGPERDAVIRLTFRQHPFPGMVLYWLFRGHLRAAGRFYRLAGAGSAAGDGEPAATEGA
jgi:hypothetical protein